MYRKTAIFLAAVMLIVTVITVVPASTVQASYVDDFLATVGPMCTNDMRDNHILASFTLAQAIYESGWGRSTLAVEANNLFGMRAYSTWTGKVYDKNQGVLYDSWDELVATKGSTYVSNYSMSFWRAFDNWQESVNSHSELFNTSSRYANLRENYNYTSCCTLVVEDGYCTDSGYTSNLIGLIEKYNLEQYNYDFSTDNGSDDDPDGGTSQEPFTPVYGDNLFSGIEVSYFLKGKWNQYSGTTSLATDGAYRGDGTHNWSGNSAIDGVTFDTADYNATTATTNYFSFALTERSDIEVININGYRENGNRNYVTLDVYGSSEAITVDANNCATVTEGLTRLNYTLEKTVISGAPESSGVDQFFNLALTFEGAAEIKGILIITNADCAGEGFFQFDEITAYAPVSAALPFTFADGIDGESATVDSTNSYLFLKNGAMTAAEAMALFADEDMGVTDGVGVAVSAESKATTGYTITTTINGISTSLVLVVRGDVNGDAFTSTADYLQMIKHIKGDNTMAGCYFAAGDMTDDNVVNTTDCAVVRKILSGE